MKLCASCQNKYPDDANFCPREECAGAEGPHRLTVIEPDPASAPLPATAPVPAAAPAADAAPPERFMLVSRIGGEASGEVWQANDSQTGAAVAYKVVAAASLPTPVMMDRALRELRQLQRTSSPRIVKVVDFAKTPEGRLYIASELAPGEPLDQVIARGGPFPLDRAKRVIAQVGEALLDAQKVGVVHRDLSAKNILVAGDDEARVINFPIARPLGDTLFGVPEFMSPEQSSGKLIDQRSNTYSIGALLYFMLTGQPPFAGSSPQETIDAIQGADLTPPSIKRAGVGLTTEVDRVVLKALERSSSRRPLTLRQFLSDVAALIVNEQNAAAATSAASGKEAAFARTMVFAGGSQEVQKLVAQAVAAREAAGSPGATAVSPKDATTVGMGPAPVPSGGMAGLPSGTPAPTARGGVGAARQSHGAAVSATMVAMPAATGGTPPPGSPAAAQPAPGAATPEAGSASAPGGVNFRETLWFKKGDVDQMVADARAKVQAIADAKKSTEKSAEEITGNSAPVAAAADEAKPLEDRYLDDGTLTADDRKNFSLRRGSGPNPTTQARGSAVPGDRMSENEVLEEIGGKKRVTIIGIAAAVAAALVAVVVVVVRGKGKAETSPPAATSPRPVEKPAAPSPPAELPPAQPSKGDDAAKEADAPAAAAPRPAAPVRHKVVAKKKPPAPPAKKKK